MKTILRTFWRISISVKLAVVIILVLTFALIAATILESIYDTPTAQYWVYQTWYFYGTLALFGWLIFAVAISRLPWQRKHLPFLSAHLGILLVLYGSWLTFQFGVDGSIQVGEGLTESAVELNEPLLLVAEGAVIGLLSWALAALAAWPVSKAIGNLMVRLAFKSGLDFFFELRGLLVWLAVSICLCVIASFLPAWKASKLTVREVLAYQ